jgi:hypothetical protein
MKNICPAEIHHHIVEVSGEGVMNERNMSKHNLEAHVSSPKI